MCVESSDWLQNTGGKSFYTLSQYPNTGGWHLGFASHEATPIKRAFKVRPCAIFERVRKSRTTGAIDGSHDNQIKSRLHSNDIFKVRAREIRQKTRSFPKKTQEESRQRKSMMNHKSLGGPVVTLLGFGHVDRGSRLTTDISFTTQWMMKYIGPRWHHITETNYTINTMIPWDHIGPRWHHERFHRLHHENTKSPYMGEGMSHRQGRRRIRYMLGCPNFHMQMRLLCRETVNVQWEHEWM